MTMRVLQIQLRSLTAMDIVAYGGAAAGIGVALWQYAHTTAAAAGASAAGWSPIMLAAHLPGAFAYLAYGLQYLMPFGAGFPLTLAGLLLIVLLPAEFFIPMRQLGSYFHVAMNGMTSTKRIFALLDTPSPPMALPCCRPPLVLMSGLIPVPRPGPRPMAESPSASTTSAIPMTAPIPVPPFSK